MKAGIWAGLTGLSVIVGCESTRLVDLRAAESWGSAVALYETSRGPAGIAVNLGTGTATLDVPRDTVLGGEVFVLFYGASLEAMLLEPGPLSLARGSVGRHLPMPALALRTPMDALSEDSSDVTSAISSTEIFRALLLPAPAPETCAEALGCYPRETGECTIPCPTEVGPISPAPAALPAFDCADWPRVRAPTLGVSSAAVADLEVCDPGRIQRCPQGQSFIPASGCVEVIPGCAGWSSGELPSDAVYVRAGSLAGDGSRNHPYATIAEALGARTGAEVQVIALGPGRFEDDVHFGGGVVVQGCDATLAGRISFDAGRSELRNLRLAPEGPIEISRPAEVSLTRVIVEPPPGMASETSILVRGRMTLRESLVETGAGAIGLVKSATASIERSQLAHSTNAIWTEPGTKLETRDAAISGTPTNADSVVLILGSARLENTVVEIDGQGQGSAIGVDLAATVALERVVIRIDSFRDWLNGLSVRQRARVDATNLLTVGGTRAVVATEASHVKLVDALLTASRDNTLAASDRAVIHGTRVVLTDAGADAVIARQTGHLELTDLSVLRSAGGLDFEDQSTIHGARIHVEDAELYGLAFASSSSSESVLSDLFFTRAGLLGIAVYTLNFSQGSFVPAHVTLQRVHISHGTGVGLWIAQGTEVQASDVVVEDIEMADPVACSRFAQTLAFTDCEGEGVRLTGTSGSISSFILRRNVRGLAVGAQDLNIANGHLEENHEGLVLLNPSIRPEPLLNRVVLRNNQQSIVGWARN